MNRFSVDHLSQQNLPVAVQVFSSEGDIYTARVTLPDGAEGIICDGQGENLMTRSLEAMRTSLADVTVTEAKLVHHMAYDEMIGMGESQASALPLHW